jgi:hypothetical protein
MRSIIQDPSTLNNIEADKFYSEFNFIGPDRIAFEVRLGESTLTVARE